jgi:integrase
MLEITRRQWPQSLAFVALALLAGIRPEETSRLSWPDVDLERGIVTVSEAACKIRRRRLVHLMPAAVAWLEVARACQSVLPIKPTTRRRMIKRLRVAAELPRWPQDIMRHTAASMMLAHTENAGKVALELGNSVTMLLNHYRELVTQEQAQAFWNLFPAEASPVPSLGSGENFDLAERRAA